MNIDTEIKLPDPWAVCKYCGLYVRLCHCHGMWKNDERLINEKAVEAMRNERKRLQDGMLYGDDDIADLLIEDRIGGVKALRAEDV